MLVEALVEGEEALQVAPFGIQGGVGGPGGFRYQVDCGEFSKAGLCCVERRFNVMG